MDEEESDDDEEEETDDEDATVRRDWREYVACEADGGSDMAEMPADDIEECKRHCERYGWGGFTVFEKVAYFRFDVAENLEKRMCTGQGAVTLYLGFERHPRMPGATPLHDRDGSPAVIEISWGLWLDPSDFIVSTREGHTRGIHNVMQQVGPHEVPRHWPREYSESLVLKNLLKKKGPCNAKRVVLTPAPTEAQWQLVDGLQLWPFQSFENALAVEQKTGMPVVRGWAIWDLVNWGPGEAYVAEQYWWNAGEDGTFFDFTPHPQHPQGKTSILLVEPDSPPWDRQASFLTLEQALLAENLFCLRFQGAAAVRSVELGTRNILADVLDSIEEDFQENVTSRRAMVKVGMCGALVRHLACRGSALAALHAMAILTNFAVDEGLMEKALAPIVANGGFEALVGMLGRGREVAATAAIVLANICHENRLAKQHALNAGAVPALTACFAREDMQDSGFYAVGHASALWSLEFELLDGSTAPDEDRVLHSLGQEHWDPLKVLCNETLQETHIREGPCQRRGNSWARTLAFAQVALGTQRGMHMRRGSEERPFMIWVLGADDTLEAALAEEGLFRESNFVDRAPTEIVIFGDGLRDVRSSTLPAEGQPPCVRTASYEEMRWTQIFGAPAPDLAAVFLPAGRSCTLPEHVLSIVAGIPVVLSTCVDHAEQDKMSMRCKLQGSLVMKKVRNPFGSTAGNVGADYVDNGWILAVQGPGALEKAVIMEATLTSNVRINPRREGEPRIPVIFWGILDIKYDTDRPVLERVKVLETGDGRTSKFSNDGAEILKRYKERYRLEQDGAADLLMSQVISGDKKLTHDVLVESGYGHIVPKQGCFPRRYRPDLARRVIAELGLRPGDRVVLKLCNRSRAAGVIVVPSDELDEVLQDLLNPPADLEAWFQEGLARIREGSAKDLGTGEGTGSFEEQRRHWWCNESPVFVAECCCKSLHTVKDGRRFDGTMRVAFVLRKKGGTQSPSAESSPLTPADLEVEWLGGYWKLPKADMDSGHLRECIISAARTAGTAPVERGHLFDVYSALGDMVQQLFGWAEPTSEEFKEKYSTHPELAAWLTARLGTAYMSKSMPKTKRMLSDAECHLAEIGEGSGTSYLVQSFISRAQAVLEARQCSADNPWEHSEGNLARSLELMPTNANGFCLTGSSLLYSSQPEKAQEYFNRTLLLDPDFKAPYVNLGVAYLRLGWYRQVVEISEAGLARHPDSPQCHYHISVACCQLCILAQVAIREDEANDTIELRAEREAWRQKSFESLQRARISDDARKRNTTKSPWLEFDDHIMDVMEEGAELPEAPLVLPPTMHWTYVSYRL